MNIDELQAGPVLDALVAERVMGWTQIKSTLQGLRRLRSLVYSGSSWLDKRTGCRKAHNRRSPSTDITAAQKVWETLPHEYDMGNHKLGIAWELINSYHIGQPHERGYICQGLLGCGEVKWFAEGDTPMLAICRVALKVTGYGN